MGVKVAKVVGRERLDGSSELGVGWVGHAGYLELAESCCVVSTCLVVEEACSCLEDETLKFLEFGC